jgi:hypothetical protein
VSGNIAPQNKPKNIKKMIPDEKLRILNIGINIIPIKII